MELIKQQRFKIDGEDCCASMYKHINASLLVDVYSIVICSLEQDLFINRSIKTRAKAEKIFNQQLADLGAQF